VSVRHVHSRPFIANVDNPDAIAGDVVPNWLDVAALQTENPINPACLEKARDPCRTTVFAGTEVLG
jgi:hypothetical protein